MTFGNKLRKAFDQFETAGLIDEEALGAALGSLGIELDIGDGKLRSLYQQLTNAAAGVDGVDFETFSSALVEAEARRRCDIAFVESDGDAILTALNHDITAVLLSLEASAHPVDFEALHVRSRVCCRFRPSTRVRLVVGSHIPWYVAHVKGEPAPPCGRLFKGACAALW